MTNFNKNIHSPFVIGALGGSGTRVIAQIAIEAGFYMGDDLNHPNDNIVFTRLFKSPKWYTQATQQDIDRRFEVFSKYMTGKKLSLSDISVFIKAARTNETWNTPAGYYLGFIKKAFFPKTIQQTAWGWKEPNNQIFIEHIYRNFPEMKYLHVLRSGLDMAYSTNLQQLNNWGKLFGVDIKDEKHPVPYHQLEYWIRSSQKTIEIGKKLLGDRFYVLNYDEMCANPSKVVPEIVKFMGVEVSEEKMKQLIALPKVTDSIGKYKDKDLTVFDQRQLETLKELGFAVQ